MINEYELEGELIPTHWCWFFVAGFIALLTSYWLSAIIAIAIFVVCIMQDIADEREKELKFQEERVK